MLERAVQQGDVDQAYKVFQWIYQQATVGICQTDLGGRFVMANEAYCRLVGRSLHELRSMTMQSITHPDDLAYNLVLFTEAIETRAPFTIEKRYVRPGGEEVWVSNHVAILCDEAGVARYVLAISLNINDRKRIERELIDRERNLEQTVRELEASRQALKEHLEELEQFHDVVVDRELRMMEVEKENAALREQLARLTGVPRPS